MRNFILIIIVLVLFISHTHGNDHQHSVILEYNFYSADLKIEPGMAIGYRFIPNNIIGFQVSYSKLPYFYADYPRIYRDRISWWSLLMVRPINIELSNFNIELTPGLGGLYQRTWHDDLESNQNTPGCFGCGDYYTANQYYLNFQIGVEIKRTVISENFQIGIGGIFRKLFTKHTMATDVHNPVSLDYTYGVLLSLNLIL